MQNRRRFILRTASATGECFAPTCACIRRSASSAFAHFSGSSDYLFAQLPFQALASRGQNLASPGQTCASLASRRQNVASQGQNLASRRPNLASLASRRQNLVFPGAEFCFPGIDFCFPGAKVCFLEASMCCTVGQHASPRHLARSSQHIPVARASLHAVHRIHMSHVCRWHRVCSCCMCPSARELCRRCLIAQQICDLPTPDGRAVSLALPP